MKYLDSPNPPQEPQLYPLASGVTPGPTVGPDGKLYILASDYDASKTRFRTQLYRSASPATATSWTPQNVTWHDASRGHVPNSFWDGRPFIESRPTMRFLHHMQGGSGMTPLASGLGYFIAWWRYDERILFFHTEGALSATTTSYSVGNYRYSRAGGSGTNGPYVPGAFTPAAAVYRDHAHLVEVPKSDDRARHLPYADGLAPYYNVHKDTDDGEYMAEHLCSALKNQCASQCTSNRWTICSPIVDPTEPEFCEGLLRDDD